ncbi:MAG: Wzz/FepE/Etk N-terminal domain-containing protein, partial [Planctomycetota bacterium]|nr:Wzz/FepE/Etk N-terminal domain-containing protein [Planctomycetota bacterium]
MINQQTTPEPVIDLSGLLRGWKTVLVTTVLAMVAGAALLVSITPHQEVSAKIIVEPREVALDGRTGAATRDKEFLPTQSEILQSPAVIEDAIQRVDKDISVDMLTSRLINITKNLKVDPLAGTSILLIRYTDVNAQNAADVLNALVASYTDYLARTEKQQHHELMLALTSRDTELQNTLSGLQSDFDQLKQSHTAATVADPVAIARIIAGLEETLATTQSRRIRLERAATRISPLENNLFAMAPGAVPDVGLNLSQDTTSANAVLNELA